MSVAQDNAISNEVSGKDIQAALAATVPELDTMKSKSQVTILVARDVPTGSTSQKHISKKKWLERSKVKHLFNVSTLGTKKIASCVFCQKIYQEGESTGNLHKHVSHNHYLQYKEAQRKETKRRTLNSLTKKNQVSTTFTS